MTIDDYKKDPWVLIIVKYNNNYIMYLFANTRITRQSVDCNECIPGTKFRKCYDVSTSF